MRAVMENKTWYHGEKIKHLILGGKDENKSENEERAKKKDVKAGEKVNKEFEREGEESKTVINSDDISSEKKSVLSMEARHKLSKEEQWVVMDEVTSMMNDTDGLQPCDVILTVLGWGPPLGGMPGSMRGHQGQGVGGYGHGADHGLGF